MKLPSEESLPHLLRAIVSTRFSGMLRPAEEPSGDHPEAATGYEAGGKNKKGRGVSRGPSFV